MATVKQVMDKVARRCSTAAPTSWIGATSDSHLELLDFLEDTLEEVRKRRDWEEPIGADAVITGPGTVVDDHSQHDLPANWYRINRDALAVYERTTTRRRGLPITTSGKWTALKSVGTAGAYRYFRITGSPGSRKIIFFRPLGANDSITIAYLTNYWNATAAGVLQSAWLNDTDIMLFDPRMIELGIRWRWLQQKGLPYDDILAEFNAYVVREGNDDRVIRKVVFGESGDEFRAPWDVPVPDFIPPSS